MVLSGESLFEEISSEAAMIEISKNYSKIYDLFEGILDESELFPTISLANEELKDIIELWKNEKEQFEKQ
ncbi:hypothetical protein PJ311_18030 [Bacillus sp. CLL-7-23]|uniref:FeS assembly protein IscX n=1 Tax=Bacillus changyiensis TaxID=3004103 RepID=A0ABT4X9P9_9BACI|nr:hypothetical protein [Bacillus changyiensis]MDA7028439.1 hypothetical protein [Bacillus changyiensis]